MLLLLSVLGCYVFEEQCETIRCDGAEEAEQCCGPSPFGSGTACWYRIDGLETADRFEFENTCTPTCESAGYTRCGLGVCEVCYWEHGPHEGERWYSCDDGAWESQIFYYGDLGSAPTELDCYCGWDGDGCESFDL